MKAMMKEVYKPISLSGCEQVFQQLKVPKSEYSQWGIGKIFSMAEKLCVENNLSVEEVFIDVNP